MFHVNLQGCIHLRNGSDTVLLMSYDLEADPFGKSGMSDLYPLVTCWFLDPVHTHQMLLWGNLEVGSPKRRFHLIYVGNLFQFTYASTTPHS